MITYEVVSNKNCNFKCYFCFANANVEQDCRALSIDDFKKGLEMSIKRAIDRKVKSLFIKIYGGESLIYTENIVGYIETVKELSKIYQDIDFSMTIITNGSIIKDSFLETVNSTKEFKNFRVSVTFSMESNKKLHDKIRAFKNGSGSYDIVSANLKKYYEVTGKYPHIQTVLSTDLLADVDGYIEFMDEFKDISLYELVPMFDDTFEKVDISLIKNMEKLFDHYIEKYKANDYLHIGLFQPFRSIANRFMKDSIKKHCNAGCDTIAIVPNGDIYPCSRFMHNGLDIGKYGNCNDYDINKKYDDMAVEYNLATTHLYDCTKCQKENDFGCLGKCLAIGVKEGFYDHMYKSVCEYNKEFGKQSNRLLEEIYNTEGFKHRYDMFTYGKNFHEDFESYCMRGGKKDE